MKQYAELEQLLQMLGQGGMAQRPMGSVGNSYAEAAPIQNLPGKLNLPPGMSPVDFLNGMGYAGNGKGPQPLPLGSSPMDAAQAAMGGMANSPAPKPGMSGGSNWVNSLPNSGMSQWSEGALPTQKIPKAKGMERVSPGMYKNAKGAVVKSKTGK